MTHFVGLDVSVKETSVCVVDGAGKVLRYSAAACWARVRRTLSQLIRRASTSSTPNVLLRAGRAKWWFEHSTTTRFRRRAPPTTTDRMRWCLDIIGWPQREAARQLPVNESAIRKMARDKSATPIPWASGAKRPLSSTLITLSKRLRKHGFDNKFV
jgi:hypothetical protein